MGIKARMKATLAGLAFDFDQFSIDQFVQFVAVQRQREIIVLAWPLPGEMCGAWVSLQDKPRDYLFHAQDLHPLLQTHTILHELSHMICGHETLTITLAEIRRLSQNDRLDCLFRDCLQRSGGNDVREQEAKILSSLIYQQILRHQKRDALTAVSPHPADAYLQDLGAV